MKPATMNRPNPATATTPAADRSPDRNGAPAGPNDGPSVDSIEADVQATAEAADVAQPARPLDGDMNRDPLPDLSAGPVGDGRSTRFAAASPPVPGRPNPEPDRPAQDPSLPHDDEPAETDPDEDVLLAP